MVHSLYLGSAESARTAGLIDHQIIEALIENGRMSGRDIAQRIGVSEATVSRRINTLETEKLVVVCGFVQPAAVGCPRTSLVRFRVDGDSAAAANALARQRGFHRVVRIDGGKELTALLVGLSTQSLLQHIDTALSAIPSLRLDRTSEVLHILPPGCAVPDPLARPEARVPRQADIQAKLLQFVRANMRRSLTEVSEHIKASPSATRANLDLMIATGVVRPVVVANPHFMGTPVMVQLRIRPRMGLTESLKVVRTHLPHAWIFQCVDGETIVAECGFASTDAAEQKSQEIQGSLANGELSTHLLLEIHSDLLNWWCDAPCKASG
jgi:Lrp/AsnC family leucine-responsive transcriptional regulator